MSTKQRKGSSKKAAAKPAARKSAASKKVAAAPAVKGQTFPCQVHVAKAGDKIPVTVKDQGHLDRLIGEHGAGAVEVQS